MSSRWRALIEAVLPWYDPARERLRDARTEMIRRRSVSLRRDVVEPIIEQYARAESERHFR